MFYKCVTIKFDITKINNKLTPPADAYVLEKGGIFSTKLLKKYIRGRGRYGATPTPKTGLIQLILQEREKEFTGRSKDPLEWIRNRLREKQRPWVASPEAIYEAKRKARPVKPVFQ